MPLRSIASWRLPLLLAVASLLGCPPPHVPPRTSAAQLLEWTIGKQNLAASTPPDVFLVLVPKDKINPPNSPKPPPSKPSGSKLSEGDQPGLVADKLSECFRATSFVPDPQETGRFFFVVDGALHVLRNGEKTTTSLEGLPSGVRISNLLATRKVPEGLELLAWVHVEGKSEYEVQAIIVNASSIVRSGIADVRVEQAAALFEQYTAPRCTPDGTRCLKVAKDDDHAFLEQWSAVGGAASTTLTKMEGAVDATWAPTNDGSVYVLQRCQ